MPERSVHQHAPSQPLDLAAVVAETVPYIPAAEELTAIRAYLRDIQAAVEELPEMEPVTVGLDVGFDPAWLEATS
jgi:hypothetical protein